MALYQYEAKNKLGACITGQLSAETEREAARTLLAQGFFVVKLNEAHMRSETREAVSWSWFSRRVLGPVLRPVGSKPLAVYFAQFASMTKAGMSLQETTELLSCRAPGRLLKRASREMHDAVQQGKKLSDVARRYPAAFSGFAIAMLEAGEVAGKLEQTMLQTSQFYQDVNELENVFRVETFYFKIMFVVSFFMILLINKISSGLFGSSGGLMPSPWGAMYAVGLLILVWLGMRFILQIKPVRVVIDGIKLHMPFVNGITKRSITSKWCRAMAMLYGAGVPIHAALVGAGDATGNAALAAKTARLAPQVMEGMPVSAVMMQSGEFPDLAVSMMVTGEKSGSVEDSLIKVAEFAEMENQTLGKQTAQLAGIVGYLLVSAFVGYFVIIFYQNYFNVQMDLGESLESGK